MNLLQPIPPIRVETPPVSILTAARTLPAGTEWRDGISFLPNGCSPASGYPNCEVVSISPEKCSPAANTRASFMPWLFYVPDGCDTKPFYAEDWDARGSEALGAYTPWAISLELDTGAMSGSPSLRSTAVDISGVGAVDVATAVGSLIRARVEQGFGGVATLHVPAWLIPNMDEDALLDRTGGQLTAAAGMARVSPGPGYTGASPDSTLNVTPPPGEGWVYITGPVEYELGPIFTHPSQAEQEHRMNTAEIYSERAGIFRFDPCGVFAVRAGGS